eukprot:1715501-Prymnesium_polylepis.4
MICVEDIFAGCGLPWQKEHALSLQGLVNLQSSHGHSAAIRHGAWLAVCVSHCRAAEAAIWRKPQRAFGGGTKRARRLGWPVLHAVLRKRGHWRSFFCLSRLGGAVRTRWKFRTGHLLACHALLHSRNELLLLDAIGEADAHRCEKVLEPLDVQTIDRRVALVAFHLRCVAPLTRALLALQDTAEHRALLMDHLVMRGRLHRRLCDWQCGHHLNAGHLVRLVRHLSRQRILVVVQELLRERRYAEESKPGLCRHGRHL